MTINFITKGNKDVSQIYLRLRDRLNSAKDKNDDGIDAISKTGLSVLKGNFKNGNIVLNKIPANATAQQKSEIAKQNLDLTDLTDKLNNYKKAILTAYTNRKEYEVINAKWIYNILNPKSEEKSKIPNELAHYFDFYINAKKKHLRATTINKIRVIGNRLKAFERDTKTTTYIQEVNNNFKQRFEDWCDEKQYHRNTFIKSIKVFATVCNHARDEHDVILHHHTSRITKGKEMKYRETDSIYLNFAELTQIENTIIKNKKQDIARDWLLISCFTAQRVSDFMRFDTDDIITIDGNKYLDIKQEKTETPILVYLNDVVLRVLDKYNGSFPPLFSKVSKQTNEIVYNKLVKEVGRVCKIDNLVTGQLKNPETNRTEIKTVKKYKLISSHIGRRSYATNYYGKINTALLIGATGHSTEVQFLRYVKAKPEANAKALAKAMRELSVKNETPMRVIKNASNQN